MQNTDFFFFPVFPLKSGREEFVLLLSLTSLVGVTLKKHHPKKICLFLCCECRKLFSSRENLLAGLLRTTPLLFLSEGHEKAKGHLEIAQQ